MFMSLGERNKQALFDDQYVRPVESIMKCEDFKSNFARRLSNRYISKSPVALRQESALKLRPLESVKTQGTREVEPAVGGDLKKSTENMEQARESPKLPDKTSSKHSEIRRTEVTALNLEVETLRWQLAQTEANRQMHVALLNQIVSFLNRVKEHMECQKQDVTNRDVLADKLSRRYKNSVDLPRSRSVLHVNKTNEYSPVKKNSTRTISKSISNVSNAYQKIEKFNDKEHAWSQSKLSLSQECDTSQKITEEIARLITLASSVMSTKLPDLACGCNGNSNDVQKSCATGNVAKDQKSDLKTNSNETLNLIEENASCLSMPNVYGNPDENNSIINRFIDIEDKSLDLIILQPPLTVDLEKDFLTDSAKENSSSKSENLQESQLKAKPIEKKFDNNATFIEDESGFSSMSSFQEIGIPIINIIPPTPEKIMTFPEEPNGVLEEDNIWKDGTIELDKNTIKVFWV